MAKSGNKGVLVAFHVPPEFYAELDAKAKQYGFQSASLYARAVVEQSHGKPETQIAMSRIGAAQVKVQQRLVKATLATLQGLTAEDLLGD